MNIRKRLKISYFLMLLIPVVLMILTGSIMQHHDRGETKNLIPSEPFFTSLYRAFSNHPDLLKEQSFLLELEELSGYSGYINLSVSYGGSEAVSLRKSHMDNRRSENSKFNTQTSWNFFFSNGTPGLLSVEIIEPDFTLRFFFSWSVTLMAAIAILIISNGMISWYVAKSIIGPIQILEKAALNIKNEDLDSPVIYGGNDEFLAVCRAFEEMRVRLKESLVEQLRSDENRKELLSNISHDLKTPITAIKGYIEGIHDGIADTPGKIEKYINTVYGKTILLNDMIDRLFLFSKLDLGKVSFHFQNIDLCRFLSDTCEELRFDYSQGELLFKLPEYPVNIKGDAVQLHRVITNLVDNAFKYGDKNGMIVTISLSVTEELAEVRVSDNGRGIDPQALPHIFDRFYRADPARGTRKEGSGLGLSISRQIILAHGGEISAQSVREKGTSINFSLGKAQ